MLTKTIDENSISCIPEDSDDLVSLRRIIKKGDKVVGDKGFFNVLTGKGEITTEPEKEGGKKKVYGIIRSKKK